MGWATGRRLKQILRMFVRAGAKRNREDGVPYPVQGYRDTRGVQSLHPEDGPNCRGDPACDNLIQVKGTVIIEFLVSATNAGRFQGHVFYFYILVSYFLSAPKFLVCACFRHQCVR